MKSGLPDAEQTVQYGTAIAMVATIFTAIPLFVSYLRGTEGIEALTHLHVWFGALWIVAAVTNFVFVKRPLFGFRRYL